MGSKKLHSRSDEATASRINESNSNTDIETGARMQETGERPENKFCPKEVKEWMRLEIDHLIKHVKKEEQDKPAIMVYKKKAIAVFQRLLCNSKKFGLKISDFKEYSTCPDKFQIFYEQLKEMKLTA